MGQGGTEREDYLSRMGTFFVLLGILLLVLFIASDIAQDPYFRYFFFGAIALGVGLFFKRLTAKPAKPTARFSGLRGFFQKRREAAKKKADAKKKK
jgi:uncharacterized membrane protein YedE/YeeE